jgi:hypothetical protein
MVDVGEDLPHLSGWDGMGSILRIASDTRHSADFISMLIESRGIGPAKELLGELPIRGLNGIILKCRQTRMEAAESEGRGLGTRRRDVRPRLPSRAPVRLGREHANSSGRVRSPSAL